MITLDQSASSTFFLSKSHVHKYLLLVSVTVTNLIGHYRIFKTMKMKMDTLQTTSTDVNENPRQRDDEKEMRF